METLKSAYVRPGSGSALWAVADESNSLRALDGASPMPHSLELTPAGVEVVEVNPRSARDMAGSQVFREDTKCSALEAALDTAGTRFVRSEPRRSGAAAMHAGVSPRRCLFRRIAEPDAVTGTPGARAVRTVTEPGERTRAAPDNGGVRAQIVAAAEDNRAAHALA